MPAVVLLVVDEPDPDSGATVIYSAQDPTSPPIPLILGTGGDVALLCGDCGFHIGEDLEGGQVSQMVLQCPRCGAFNRTRT